MNLATPYKYTIFSNYQVLFVRNNVHMKNAVAGVLRRFAPRIISYIKAIG